MGANSPHKHEAEDLGGHLLSTAAVSTFLRLFKHVWLCVLQTLASVRSAINWHLTGALDNFKRMLGTACVYKHTDTC